MLSLIDNEAQRSMQPPLATDGDYGFGFITNEITRPIGGLGALPELPDQPWNFGAEELTEQQRVVRTAWALAATASFAASIFHGYKRNDSLGWGLWWGLMGALFPIVTPTVAVAQGFGKRKR